MREREKRLKLRKVNQLAPGHTEPRLEENRREEKGKEGERRRQEGREGERREGNERRKKDADMLQAYSRNWKRTIR